MKKFILFVILTAAFLAASAQTKTATISEATWSYDYTVNTASDTIGATTTTYTCHLTVNKYQPLLYNIQYKLTELTGTAGVKVSIYGRDFNSSPTQAWTRLDSTVYYGTGSDTTAYFTSKSTATYYRQYAIKFVRTGGTVKISAVKFKLWQK